MIFLLSLCSVCRGSEEALPEQIVKQIAAEKKEAVAAGMDLSAEEGRGFWPIYGEYQKDMREILDEIIGFVRNYQQREGKISREEAESLLTKYIELETKKLTLKKRYIERFKEVLPAEKVFRYLQMENKGEAAFYYKLAENLPLAQ
jgi:hypothetical protein